ncbi:hypothetical protein J7E63_16255 [Bacillus sp. ISL-75]|uniref:hypothetical protein n=1 Tax=Bacillus sp. ISL-75 TaxID=2819137 RepID=UPI001BE6E6D3|nr:hypothetical protein [Bacillus sp. ISL-75]MBT2728479.1 hypothetical protein [Bacillus sp. ISL-75]
MVAEKLHGWLTGAYSKEPAAIDAAFLIEQIYITINVKTSGCGILGGYTGYL